MFPQFVSQKTRRLKKKIHKKNWVQSDSTAIFLKNFEKKNRKKKILVQKFFFFESCYFIFEHGEKKKFFF